MLGTKKPEDLNGAVRNLHDGGSLQFAHLSVLPSSQVRVLVMTGRWIPTPTFNFR